MSEFEAVLYSVAESPWALVALALLLIVDGFFPLVPGETMVVTLAALGASGHGPPAFFVLWVAIIATMAGDAVAFAIGRRLHPSRWSWMRGDRSQRAFVWAAARIATNPGLVLVAAKFLPFVRVAVTMTAGASTLTVKRYLVFSFVAAVIYTGYHVVVAVTAGSFFVANPMLGLASSIGFGIVSGALIAGIHRLIGRRRAGSAR